VAIGEIYAYRSSLMNSKNLAPVYEQLADVYQYAKDKVVVAKVDADAHRELGQRFGIKGIYSLSINII